MAAISSAGVVAHEINNGAYYGTGFLTTIVEKLVPYFKLHPELSLQ